MLPIIREAIAEVSIYNNDTKAKVVLRRVSASQNLKRTSLVYYSM